MTTISDLMTDGTKQAYISKDSITLIHSRITSIGIQPMFQNILRLHLSHNKIATLNGMEQFQQLQYLSITHNLIEAVGEFDKVSKHTLLHLCVQNNPFTIHPDYGYILLRKFRMLKQLDNDKIDGNKIENYKVKCETFGFIVIQYMMNNYFEHLDAIFQNHSLTYMDKLLAIIDKLLQEKKSQLEECSQVVISNQTQLANDILKHVIAYQKNKFTNNSLQAYLTSLVLQSSNVNLNKFAEDQEYYFSCLVEVYMNRNIDDETPKFPTYAFNQQYNLALLDYIHQLQLFKQPTRRQIEDRPKQLNEIKSVKFARTVPHDTYEIHQQQNDIQINQQSPKQQQQQDYAPTILHYKSLYKYHLGFKKLHKISLQTSFKVLLLKVTQQFKIKQAQIMDGLYKFIHIHQSLDQNMKQQTITQILKHNKLHSLLQVFNSNQQIIKALSFRYLKDVISKQIKLAQYKRKHYLKKLAFYSLIPHLRIQRIASKLTLKLLNYKVLSVLRISLQQIKCTAIRTTLPNFKDNKATIKRRKIPKQQFLESTALEQFKRQRDLCIYN